MCYYTIALSSDYSIVIQDLMVTDEGSYMCVADFKEGQFRSAPAHLVVLGKFANFIALKKLL